MWYDVFVVAVLIVCMVRGAMRGMIWQLAGIAGLVLCLVFAETIAAAIGPHVGLAEPLNHWVVMFAAYLVFSFLSFGVARLFHGWIEKAQMTEFNRHLGAVFGLVKGVAICLVLTFFIVTLSPNMRTMLQHSRSGYAAAVIMDRLHPVMPEKLHHALEDYIHQLDSPEYNLHYSHHHDHDHQHAHGGDAHSDHPADGGSWDWNPVESGSIDAVDEIVSRIPVAGREQARSLIEQAYHRAPPELKANLLEELKSAAPSMILAVASEWLNQAARPGDVNQPNSNQPNPNDRQGLIDAIAAGYAAAPAERRRLAAEIDESLRGLPDNIALGVLRDWRADLTGTAPDPDPQTSEDTPVDQRIIRQLTIQRVSVYQLSQSLQDRLRAAAQR